MGILYTVPDLLKKASWERDGIPKRKMTERLQRTGIGEAMKEYEALAAKGLGKLVAGATAGRSAAKAALQRILEAVKTSEDKSKGNGPYLEYLTKIKIAARYESTRISNTLAALNAQSIVQDTDLNGEFGRWAKTLVGNRSGRAAGMGLPQKVLEKLLTDDYLKRFRTACSFSVG
jgi:hypothetical protein